MSASVNPTDQVAAIRLFDRAGGELLLVLELTKSSATSLANGAQQFETPPTCLAPNPPPRWAEMVDAAGDVVGAGPVRSIAPNLGDAASIAAADAVRERAWAELAAALISRFSKGTA